jgi:hypothetical protein
MTCQLGQQPTMDVFVQPWTYVEPTLFTLRTTNTQGQPHLACLHAECGPESCQFPIECIEVRTDGCKTF